MAVCVNGPAGTPLTVLPLYCRACASLAFFACEGFFFWRTLLSSVFRTAPTLTSDLKTDLLQHARWRTTLLEEPTLLEFSLFKESDAPRGICALSCHAVQEPGGLNVEDCMVLSLPYALRDLEAHKPLDPHCEALG